MTPETARWFLPSLNAGLNFTTAVLLITGYVFIRKGMQRHHIFCMSSALVTSALFLVSYLTYHFVYHGMTRFQGPSVARVVYLGILLTHTILAVVIVPMVLVTVAHALRGFNARHRRLARWTLPLWLYVSVTGVVIYVMLYHIYPSAAPVK